MSGSIRYSRQITLSEWGEAGQERLTSSRALIIGLGGLGVPAATYLASSGVSHLVLNDFDTVDESNLARQPLYTPADIGRPKVECAAEFLGKQNPACELSTVDSRLDERDLQALISGCDVVLDCSDNFATRFAVNAGCVKYTRPLVSGAAIRYECQLAVFRPDLGIGPCYRCLYNEESDDLEDCRGQGVLAPMVGLMGAAMAVEALRVLLGFGDVFHSRVLICDVATARWREVALKRDPGCPVCAEPPS